MDKLTMKRDRMIDIHMHLIYGVDDGAYDLGMTQMMLFLAKEQGIYKIFATPHSYAFDDDKENVKNRFQELIEEMGEEYRDAICLGCEVLCEQQNMEKVIDALNNGKYPTMKGTKYVLVEFLPWANADSIKFCIETLRKADYKPIVAHVERYQSLKEEIQLINDLKNMESLIQLNVYSLEDSEEVSVREWSRRLVKEKKVDFLGTDAHRTYQRPPSVRYGLKWLYNNTEQEYAEAIAWKNAEELLWTKS